MSIGGVGAGEPAGIGQDVEIQAAPPPDADGPGPAPDQPGAPARSAEAQQGDLALHGDMVRAMMGGLAGAGGAAPVDAARAAEVAGAMLGPILAQPRAGGAGVIDGLLRGLVDICEKLELPELAVEIDQFRVNGNKSPGAPTGYGPLGETPLPENVRIAKDTLDKATTRADIGKKVVIRGTDGQRYVMCVEMHNNHPKEFPKGNKGISVYRQTP